MASPNPARRYAELQLRYDAELNRVLERAARDIRTRLSRLPLGVGGQVRSAQLRLALQEIRNVQQTMWNGQILDTIVTAKGLAAEVAEGATEVLERVLYASLPESVADVVRDGLRATAMAGIESDVARVPRTLSARVYHDFALTSGKVEETIRAGIVSGLSARELAQSVYQYISPTTPGGASYAANRLARTEINNAFHEQQIKGGQRPGVLGVVWNLSGSHGRPDECNQFASQNADNLGRGVYKPGNVPGKPHSQCLCFLTYETMDPDQFAKALKNGKFNDSLDEKIQANLRRLDNGETPIPGAPRTTKNIDHSTHDHPNTTAARSACRKRLQALENKEVTLPPDTPTVFHEPKAPKVVDPHPKLSALPRTSASQFGGVEEFAQTVTKANGGLTRYYKGPRYQTNCQQVVQACELRARGFDVMAKARRADYSNTVVADGWRYPDGFYRSRYGPRPVINYNKEFDDILNILSGYKEGERAWVYCRWKSGGAHIFNVGIENGRLVWYDGQPSKLIGRHLPDLPPPTSVNEVNGRTLSGFDQFGRGPWGIIQHTEKLIPDDDVFKNIEVWK